MSSGLYVTAGMAVLSNTRFENNEANNEGGGMYAATTAIIQGHQVVLRNNRVSNVGGGTMRLSMRQLLTPSRGTFCQQRDGGTFFGIG